MYRVVLWGWSVLYWEEGGRRVRSDHCQLIRPSTHKCIWLFSVRFVSYITFHLIKGLSQSLTIFLTALSDPILEIYILNSSQIQSNRVDQVVEMWESENSGPAPLFLLVDVSGWVQTRARRLKKQVWGGLPTVQGICQQSHPSLLTLPIKTDVTWLQVKLIETCPHFQFAICNFWLFLLLFVCSV